MSFRIRVSFSIPSFGIGIVEQASELIREQQTKSARRQRNRRPGSYAPECLWRQASPMEEHDDRWVPHRIVRRTHQSVLVEADPFLGPRGPVIRPHARRSHAYWIDRAELERLGFARVKTRNLILFTSPAHGDRVMPTVSALRRMELWFPYTEWGVDRAYRRRALSVHPDTGGSDEQFVQLQEDHRRAILALKALNRGG